MLQNIAEEWNTPTHEIRVLARAVNMHLDNAPQPDHAGLLESTPFSTFWPGYLHLEKLAPLDSTPSPNPDGDLTGPHRHDPAHPLWGVIGRDPRTFDSGNTLQLLDAVVGQLVSDVMHETARTRSPS